MPVGSASLPVNNMLDKMALLKNKVDFKGFPKFFTLDNLVLLKIMSERLIKWYF